MSRRREKRSWNGEKGSLGDGKRRRSPRLAGSTLTSACLPQFNGDCSEQSNNNPSVANVGGDAIANARVTTSKHHKLLLYNSGDNEEDNDKFVPSSRSCPWPYAKALAGHQLHSYEQDDGAPTHHDHSNNDESWLPEKSILELVLDTLQRRDTYDIFAEPVDPSEVEEYYEIVEEPMDFGTMRAKLHEGMYKNLLQFERDIFLIFGNAMHFNSSATVYFRQARALGKLAKQVFHFLKTDPENFKLEFTATRRRPSRRFNGELSGLTIGSGQKLARDLGSNSACADISPKGYQRQERTLSTGIDRRSTYKPWMLQLDEASSTLSPLYCGTKTLICGQPEMGYKESLMSFVKDLGPTAHKIAKSKMQGLKKQASSSNLSMSCWNSATHHKCEATHAANSPLQRESADSSCCRSSPSPHPFQRQNGYHTREGVEAHSVHSINNNMMLPPSSFISISLNPINLPCSKSRLRESLSHLDNSHNTNSQQAALKKL